MAEKMHFKRPDGAMAPAIVIPPEAGTGGAPGLVVIQEWWGVNAYIQRVGRRFSDLGYQVLIPDLYRGKVALDRAEALHNMTGLNFADAATQDVRGAVQWLQGHGSGRVGVIGFCMGGVLAVLAAMHVTEVSAAVSWYGIPQPDAGDPAAILTPLQCHFGLKDQSFPVAQTEAFERRLGGARPDHACYCYDAAHAFGNEDGPNYDAAAAALAWDRSTQFLTTHLRA